MINGQMVNDSSLSDDWAPVRLTPKYWLIFRIIKKKFSIKNKGKGFPSPLSVYVKTIFCVLEKLLGNIG